MRLILFAAVLAASLEAVPAAAQKAGSNATIPADPAAQDPRLADASSLIRDGKPDAALTVLDRAIADFESQNSRHANTLYFSARSSKEALIYALTPAAQGKTIDVIVTDGNWGDAYFLKGFALIDAKRPDEAIHWFDKAVTLSPRNAHFLAERAEWYKTRHDWERAYQEFDNAFEATEFSEADVLKAEKGRALRGMAYVRVEQNRLDEAEKLIKQALEVDPADSKALNELEFIKSQR